jgi:hypothetical protein
MPHEDAGHDAHAAINLGAGHNGLGDHRQHSRLKKSGGS